MGDPTLRTDLGRVLVTGGSGFVGANLVTTLLGRGLEVRSFDRVPSPLPAHPKLQTVVGAITDTGDVAAAVDGVDTLNHFEPRMSASGDGARSKERTWCPRSSNSVTRLAPTKPEPPVTSTRPSFART